MTMLTSLAFDNRPREDLAGIPASGFRARRTQKEES